MCVFFLLKKEKVLIINLYKINIKLILHNQERKIKNSRADPLFAIAEHKGRVAHR